MSSENERANDAIGSELPLTGRCLCGLIRYELDAPIELLVNCHCRFCRRAHGAAFVTTSPVATSSFRIVQGEGELASHESRFFCRQCATRLFNRTASPLDLTIVMVSSLDREPTQKPSMHMNLESKAPWYEILDDAPQFESLPAHIARALSNPD